MSNRKLSPENLNDIKALSGVLSYAALGRCFGVGRETIRRAVGKMEPRLLEKRHLEMVKRGRELGWLSEEDVEKVAKEFLRPYFTGVI